MDCGDRQRLIHERVMFLVEQVKAVGIGPPVSCLLHGPSGRYLSCFMIKFERYLSLDMCEETGFLKS